MTKILIIGAGGVGRVVAHKCAQLSEVFTEIMLASQAEIVGFDLTEIAPSKAFIPISFLPRCFFIRRWG